MEYKDTPDNKPFADSTETGIQTIFNTTTNDIDPKTLKNIAVLFNDINKVTKNIDFGILRDAAILVLSEIRKVIDSDPKLRNMILDELGDEEFQKIIDKIAQKHGIDLTESKEIEVALKSKLPDNYYIANNKLANEMTKDFLDNGNITLAIIKPNKKGEIVTYNSLTYDSKEINISGRQEFTAYDRAVHNAICTLYEAGNDTFTPQMVYRTLNGMTDSEYVSPQAIEAVTKSIDKSRFTRLKVDFTEEAKARNINIDKAQIDSYLLAAKAITVSTGGKEVTGYKLLEKPALYNYAQRTKQILSVPINLLDTREATRNTEEIIPIKEYLIRRIEIMKHNKGISNKLVYDTIFSEVGIDNPTKQKASKLRNNIKAILDLWIKKKYIKKFSEYKDGQNLKGIEISY